MKPIISNRHCTKLTLKSLFRNRNFVIRRAGNISPALTGNLLVTLHISFHLFDWFINSLINPLMFCFDQLYPTLIQLFPSLSFDVCPLIPHSFPVSLLYIIGPFLACFQFCFLFWNRRYTRCFFLRLSRSWMSSFVTQFFLVDFLLPWSRTLLVSCCLGNTRWSGWWVSPRSCVLSGRKSNPLFPNGICYLFYMKSTAYCYEFFSISISYHFLTVFLTFSLINCKIFLKSSFRPFVFTERLV